MTLPEDLGASEDSKIAADVAVDLAMKLGTLTQPEIVLIVNALAESYLRGVDRGGKIALAAIDGAFLESRACARN